MMIRSVWPRSQVLRTQWAEVKTDGNSAFSSRGLLSLTKANEHDELSTMVPSTTRLNTIRPPPPTAPHPLLALGSTRNCSQARGSRFGEISEPGGSRTMGSGMGVGTSGGASAKTQLKASTLKAAAAM